MEPREGGERSALEWEEGSREGPAGAAACLGNRPVGSRWEIGGRDHRHELSFRVLTAPTRRVLESDVVIPPPPIHSLKS